MVKWLSTHALILICAATQAEAAERRQFSIPAMPLNQAIIRLGEQAGVSVGSNNPGIGITLSRAVRGRMTIVQALRRMLDGTGFSFVFVDTQTVRVITAPLSEATRHAPTARSKPRPVPRGSPPSPVAPPRPVEAPVEIIVTANKQNQFLSDYTGTARLVEIGGIGLPTGGGTAALVGRIPELNSTNLGPGRNKIFVRGIADSSFSGPTQSTVGLYLGELRLTYNAPEPDLRYYDVEKVEILEGPQGTLYGAGSLGGVVRITPNAPDSTGFHAQTSAGYAVTSNGADSRDISGMVNIPLVSEELALRIVGYQQIEGGYIDNIGINQNNTNRTVINGARAIVEAKPGDGWRIALSGVYQNIDTRDGQYAEHGLGPLTHNAAILQPHDNDFRGADLVVEKKWDRIELLSSTGAVLHDLSERFDASSSFPGFAYDREERIRLLTHETRLASRGGRRSSWVTGISYVSNSDRMEQLLGVLPTPPSLSVVRNEKEELALFGEATLTLLRQFSVTAGSRLLRAKTAAEITGTGTEPTRSTSRLLPTLGFAWKPRERLQAFARFRSGFRSGGIAVDARGGINRFTPDKIYTGEVGVRFGNTLSAISGDVIVSYADWHDIQADLVDADGFPTTLNIGTGHISSLQSEMIWRPTATLLIEGAVFLNKSALDSPALDLEGLQDISLPNIPRYGARLSGRLLRELTSGKRIQADVTIRYRSGSNVGTLPPLALEQGEYVEAGLAALLDGGAWKLSLDATNLLNAKENSFSFGNPFTAAAGRDVTPLRPRTVRLGVTFGF